MVSPTLSKHRKRVTARRRMRHTQLSSAQTLRFEPLESRHLLANTIEHFPGISTSSEPPDTVGDVGPKHYVQMVNATKYQIFDKTGTSLVGPLEFGDLWPSRDVCRSNAGDPIVVYDHLADRWLLTQFAIPSHMCMAVSQTSNPAAGTWFTYTFDTGVDLPDYPKIGVWPNGYYMSSFEPPTSGTIKLGIYAFDRTAMLTGGSASFVKTTIPALGTPTVRETRILPADLDGAAPPVGTPNYFVRTVDSQQDPSNPVDRIEIYAATPNFAAGTLAFPKIATLAPNPFQTMTCDRTGNGLRDCIPQPGVSDTLDALSNRPMMQLRYRNFGTHESMVFNQTIDVESFIVGFNPVQEVAGIRWYELRKTPGTNWTIFQQGNHLPQGRSITAENQILHRWMGSAAMDGQGNIAMAYSITNSNPAAPVFAGARYASRAPLSPLGTMGTEKVIQNGLNAQDDGNAFARARRWGDYATLSVDPLDDSTFWFTTHYASASGSDLRPTSISSFLINRSPTITLGAASNNIVLRKVAGEATKIEVLVDGSVTNVYVLADLTKLTINSGAGSDFLTVDFVNGNPIPAGGLAFNGQSGVNDRLRVLGGSFSTITKNFINANSGSIVLSSILSARTITYTGLEPVSLSVASVANMIFNLPAGPNLGVVLGDDIALLPNMSEIRGTTFENTSFKNPTNVLTVNLGNLGDSITLQTMDTSFLPTVTTTINGGNGDDTIVGGNLKSTLNGNGGVDQLTSGGGNEIMNGGPGDDIYKFDADLTLGFDSLSDPSGFDTIDFSATTRAVNLNLGLVGAQVVNPGLTLTLAGIVAEVVIGGDGRDALTSGPNNNILIGSGGDDILVGGVGRNILIGGLGADNIRGLGGDDLLIAGFTSYDSDIAALKTIFTEWIGVNTYAIRVAKLRAGIGGIRLQATGVGRRVFNDARSIDTLVGGTDNDWYFASLTDNLSDQGPLESLDVI